MTRRDLWSKWLEPLALLALALLVGWWVLTR